MRVGWNSPELRDRLTILLIVRTRTEAHFSKSQVGMGSESDCLLGKLRKISISVSVTGLRAEKLEGVFDVAVK